MNSYKEILKAEKEVFTHMKEPQPDMKNINKKIEVVTKNMKHSIKIRILMLTC